MLTGATIWAQSIHPVFVGVGGALRLYASVLRTLIHESKTGFAPIASTVKHETHGGDGLPHFSREHARAAKHAKLAIRVLPLQTFPSTAVLDQDPDSSSLMSAASGAAPLP